MSTVSREVYEELVVKMNKSLVTIKEVVARAIDGDSLEISEAVIHIEDEADKALKELKQFAESAGANKGRADIP